FEETNGSGYNSSYNARNQLKSRELGGSIAVAGTVDESATVTVNGRTATAWPGNRFESQITTHSGANTFTVRAVDASGNATPETTYRVQVSAVDANDETLNYDRNGNLVHRKIKLGQVDIAWNYVWDAENRLVQVLKDGSEVAHFAYDPLGRRVEKV